ncbi:poly(3-hydroxyalkanoate) depolymerase [Variovorax sp.]|uniref:poly(3-hydroxyalkanoate) depolymerase n=1 Tax=Variovorax sp. TaxID=1871043 RepID=UPI002D451B57|nr:poly(3-hydroxyalkanoate) depolymerase [Variovorax sp.]HYP82859.1 poly(3-hydroxyalkanoate) depolymerase [Variovorax sp.]
MTDSTFRRIPDAVTGPAYERLRGVEVDPSYGLHVGTIDIDGQALRVGIRPRDRAAPADAGRRPLLLFNGIGANLELCGPLMACLAGRETIAFDVPGTGQSPAPGRPYRLFWLAQLARRLLDRLGVEQVDVLGISWGGALAQQFALQYGRRVGRLVLAATSTGGATMVPPRPSVLMKLASPRRLLDKGYLSRIAPEIYGGRMRSDPQALRLLGELASGGDPAGYRYQLLAMVGWTSLPWLWRLRQPVLVMAGSDDPLVPLVNARMLAALLPRARLCVVDDGHLFLLTRAREVAPLISSFLDQAEAAGR